AEKQPSPGSRSVTAAWATEGGQGRCSPRLRSGRTSAMHWVIPLKFTRGLSSGRGRLAGVNETGPNKTGPNDAGPNNARPNDAVVAERLVKTYKDVTALEGLDLRVPKGSVLGVLGP